MLFNKKVFAISVLTTLMTANVHAAGFAIAEHSASGMGSAFAGAAATAEDASTTYFNPAGLSKLEGSQILVAGHYVAPASSFANNGSSLNPLVGGAAISGSGEDGGNGAFIPNFYYATKLNEKWAFGLGINAPFGQSTEYSESWVGRYHATKSEIVALNINPSASFKVNDKLSFGFGASVQYFEATLANQLDSAAICVAAVLAVAGNPVVCTDGTFGMTAVGDVATDSSASLSADDWSLGWNVGLLYDISTETRLGMAYRSSVKHALAGSADFTRSTELNNFLVGVGSTAFTDTAASTGINLPETLSLSLQHAFNPKWTMLADVTWTRWSRFDQLVIDYSNPAQPTTTIPENWENSLRYSVGVNYQADSKWIYRAGLALDESPIASAEDRTPRLADNDRFWVSLGFGYKMSDTSSIDVGYSHLFFDDTAINNTDASFEHTLTGTYDISVDIFSAQYIWKF